MNLPPYWLGADPTGGIFYGSDYFDKCYEYAEKLILEGKAYVDDLTRDEMREYRGNDAGKPSRPSPWRDRSPEENLDLFRRMRAGEFKEGEKTLRAKIDLASPNMNMRDPAIYRIKYAEHHRQGSKWCIYPMYDFAHPIQDAIEGGVGVVKTQVEFAAVLVGNGPVDIDGLGAADVQIAVGLRREAGVDLLHLALGKVGIDDICQKVFISHIGSPCQGTQRAPYTHNTI